MKKTLTALALTLVAGSMMACGGEAPATNNANTNKPMPATNANTAAPATTPATNTAPAMNANAAKPMNANAAAPAGEKKAEPANANHK